MNLNFPEHIYIKSVKIFENTEKKPVFSIIIPTYNRDIYLDECIQSALNQDYDNVEIIIIDHNATEKNIEIYKKYINNNDNISLVKYSQNHGIYKVILYCWNIGLLNAQGEFVAVLNDDDYISTNYVDRMVKLFIENNNCITASPQPVSYDQGTNTMTELTNLRPRYMSGFDLANEIIEGNKNKLFGSSGGVMCYRKKNLINNGGFDIIADWSQVLKHSVLGDTGFDPEAKLFWRHHSIQWNRLMQNNGDVFYNFQLKGINDSKIIEFWMANFGTFYSTKLKNYLINCLEQDVIGVLQRQLRRRSFSSVQMILKNTYSECPHLLIRQSFEFFKFLPWAFNQLYLRIKK